MKNTIILLMFTTICFACSNNSTENKTTNKDTVVALSGQYGYIEGNTQGSTYHIKYKINGDSIKIADVTKILIGIEMSLSIYNKSSIVSRINNNDTTVITDKYFEDVFAMADSVYKISNGMFDITVGPLVKAWGFAPDEHKELDSKKIIQLKNLVGFDKIKLENHKLIKSNPKILIDPNAIAQGYTVEVISDFLLSKGVTDYMVEIGGEVKVKGLNDKGTAWNVGIDKPISENLNIDHELQTVVSITNNSINTSGSYRKFIEENGIKYSHEINPKTGMATHSNLLSVTVITQNCAYADAIATAIMVMGLENGKKFVQNHKEIEAYFIFVNKKGAFETWNTDGLNSMIKPIE